MLESDAPVGIRPMKVALVTFAACPKTKSSAVSVSRCPPTAGPEAVAIFPSGLPVLNNNVLAMRGLPENKTEATMVAIRRVLCMGFKAS